jgi:hypothetical protein
VYGDFGDLRSDFCVQCDLGVMCEWGFVYGKVLVMILSCCLWGN